MRKLLNKIKSLFKKPKCSHFFVYVSELWFTESNADVEPNKEIVSIVCVDCGETIKL